VYVNKVALLRAGLVMRWLTICRCPIVYLRGSTQPLISAGWKISALREGNRGFGSALSMHYVYLPTYRLGGLSTAHKLLCELYTIIHI